MSENLRHAILRQYRNSKNLNARQLIHIKYAPPGKGWPPGASQLADTGLITAGATVLDIGCGHGQFWVANSKKLPPGIDLTLADLSPGMVAEATKNVSAADGKWMSIGGQVADVCALPFADDSFDIVMAMHMLYHAVDQDRAVSEIARVLRPDGTFIATTNGTETLQELYAVWRSVVGIPRYSSTFNLENGGPMLRKYFQNVQVNEMTDVLHVTDAQDIVDFVTSYPPGNNADEVTLRTLDEELALRMNAHGGVFPLTRIAGYMVARGHK